MQAPELRRNWALGKKGASGRPAAGGGVCPPLPIPGHRCLSCRAPPLLSPAPGPQAWTRLGRLALRAGTGDALPWYPASCCRMIGAELGMARPRGQLGGPGAYGLHSFRVSRGEVDTFGGLLHLKTRVGRVGDWSCRKSPSLPWLGKVTYSQHCSPGYPALTVPAAAAAGKARSAGTAPGAAGSSALGGARESLWEIPAPLPLSRHPPSSPAPFLAAERQSHPPPETQPGLMSLVPG